MANIAFDQLQVGVILYAIQDVLSVNEQVQDFYLITLIEKLGDQDGAHVAGANCGNGIEKMLEIATKMRDITNGLLVIQSNAGIPSIKKNKIIYPETPEYMADFYLKMLKLPINMLGGCCGTGPEHIKYLRKTLDTFKSNQND